MPPSRVFATSIGGRSVADLARAVASTGAVVLDVRYLTSHKCREWTSPCLRKALEAQYEHLWQLGQVPKTDPIIGVRFADWHKGYALFCEYSAPVIMLCGCAGDVCECHRADLMRIFRAAGIPVETLDWKALESSGEQGELF